GADIRDVVLERELKVVQVMLRRPARHANVKPAFMSCGTRSVRIWKRGAPVRAIQELAGHQDLGTTQRYMHLSPAAIEAAIRLLDASEVGTGNGNMVATAATATVKIKA